MLSERPVRATCKHCDGTGFVERKLRSGQCPAPWWDMTREPFQEWACGRPPIFGSPYCAEHKRQVELLTGGAP